MPVFILNGQFPDGFPQDEDPVPFDGNPHPVNGPIHAANQNAPQGWQHELHGAAQQIQNDHGLNDVQMAEVQNDLLNQGNNDDVMDDAWDDWPVDQADNVGQQQAPQDVLQQQESISYEQSGSSAHYLRANGPDITLTVDDILSGNLEGSSSSSSSTEVTSQQFLQIQPGKSFWVMESLAFQRLHAVPIPPVHFPVILDRVDLLSFNLRQNLDSHSSSDFVYVNN